MHGISFIHIDGDEVKVECHCGWTSKPHASETDAREEYDKHEKKAG